MESEQPQAPASDDPDDAADQAESAEQLFRAQGGTLSRTDLDEAERFGEVAGTLVLAGVPVLRAWEAANAWLEEHPKGLPEWVTPETRRPTTMPPPRPEMVAPQLVTMPRERKCLHCGLHKAFPGAFTRHGSAGPRTSTNKCNDCFAKRPGNIKRSFKPDMPQPGPRVCAFCTQPKIWPKDFEHPTRPNLVSGRKCTSCRAKGVGRELEIALTTERNEKTTEQSNGAMKFVGASAAPQEPSELPSAAPPPSLAERRAMQAPPRPSTIRPPTPDTEPLPTQPNDEEKTMAQTTRELVINALTKRGPMIPSEISAATGLHISTLNGALIRMRAEGVVEKSDEHGSPYSMPHGPNKKTSKSKPPATAASSRARVANGKNVDVMGTSTSLTIPEAPEPLEETALVKALLKEREDIVAVAKAESQIVLIQAKKKVSEIVAVARTKVGPIDQLLERYKVAN